MAKLLLMHLRDGMCEENRVMSREAVLSMQADRAGDISPNSYGLGWWMSRRSWMAEEDGLYLLRGTGKYGSIAWLDTKRMIGGFAPIDAYELLLKARYTFFYGTPDSLLEAIDYTQQAIAVDPE